MSENLNKRIDRLCKIVGKTQDELQKNGEWILGLAGDVCRDTSLYADETVEGICCESIESDEYRRMSEGLVRLEFFASEMTRQKYQAEISEIMGTAWMLKVIETIKANMYSFRKYGPQFVSILSLAYEPIRDANNNDNKHHMRDVNNHDDYGYTDDMMEVMHDCELLCGTSVPDAFTAIVEAENKALREKLIEALPAAMAALPEKQRRRIVMHVYEGKTLREIADIEGTKEAPINRSIQKAKKNLRDYLKKIS